MNDVPEKILLTIDGRGVEARGGMTILESALAAGMYIPHLCHHPDLRPLNACGLCAVALEGEADPVAACSTPVAAGMNIATRTERIDRLRKLALELLLSGHPPDCGTCNKYLNCELQSLKQYFTLEDLRVRRRTKPFPIVRDNPLFVHDFSRCVLCGRCVRACHELRGAGVLFYGKKGKECCVGTAEGISLAESGCVFCGACAEVCPTGAIMDKEELTRGKNRKRALVPCRYTCPAEIDVPGYIRFIRERKYAAATALIRERVPFPAVLGHVCTHPCESECRRSHVNEAIAIRELKRYAVDHDDEALWLKNRKRKADTGAEVAIVGSGPSGLTAAYCLAGQGHSVTVFEAFPSAGGMMRYGIPDYRLPRKVLDQEIEFIVKAGVEIILNHRVESLDDIWRRGFNAVLLAVGTHDGQKFSVDGADAEGVWTGVDFMRKANLGEQVPVEDRVVVIGGGNVAMDCARMSLRLGAKHVMVACIEDREEMRADPGEVAQAEAEGVTLCVSTSIRRILTAGGKVRGVELLDVASFEFDEDRNLETETVEGSERCVDADTVIFAIGQRAGLPPDFRLDMRADRFIEIDSCSFETSREGAFAAGDAVSGEGTLIDAIASGRKAAMAIDRFLGGSGSIDEKLAETGTPGSYTGSKEGFASMNRCSGHESGCENGREMDAAAADREAQRCLQCDLRLKIRMVKVWSNY
jgi:formate dehydrogenase (NADP+) beta subunit